MWAKFLSVVKSPCPLKGLHFLFPLSQKCHLGLDFVKRNIHCSSPLNLWFVLPADAAETTRAMKTESDFRDSHLQ